jgi:hypothetical protein
MACSGADRAILFGEPVAFNKLTATRRGNYRAPGEHVSVTFASEHGPPTRHTSSTSWGGVTIGFVSAEDLQPADLPLTVELAALPAGWEVRSSKYGGGCDGPEGPCKSHASPALTTETPLLSGFLRVTSDRPPIVSLCLSARAEPDGEVELFAHVNAVVAEEI